MAQPPNLKEPKALSLNQLIKARQDELAQIHASMSVYLTQRQPREKVVRINELQERLEFRIKQAELQLVTEKINVYGEVLKILKK